MYVHTTGAFPSLLLIFQGKFLQSHVDVWRSSVILNRKNYEWRLEYNQHFFCGRNDKENKGALLHLVNILAEFHLLMTLLNLEVVRLVIMASPSVQKVICTLAVSSSKGPWTDYWSHHVQTLGFVHSPNRKEKEEEKKKPGCEVWRGGPLPPIVAAT